MPYFRAFQLFWLRLPYLWIQSPLWWISIVSYFDIQVNPCWNRTLTYHFATSISLNHDWTLGGTCYIHLTMRTNAVFMGFSATLDTVSISFNSFFWMTIFRFFLLWHFQQSSWNRTLTYPHFAFIGYNHGFRFFRFHGFNHGCFLEVTPIRFVTQKTVP